jgi:hypothetical protein
MPHSIYVWGNLDFRRTISAAEEKDTPILEWPVRMPDIPVPGSTIDSIAAGDRHCLYISGGRLFGFGSNAFRQIHHLALNVCDAPVEIKLPPSATGKPVEVACGAGHSLVRLDDGSVMSAGNNVFKQLGQVADKATPHEDEWRAWSRVALPVPAQRVYARGDASFVLHDGSVYSWGAQRHGHLGHGTTGEVDVDDGAPTFVPVEYPTKVQWFASQKLKIVEIAVGATHMLARTETEIFAVGSNSYGKLGVQGISTALLPQPVRIVASTDVPEQLLSITAGTEQSMAVYNLPKVGPLVYIWGKQGPDSSSVPSRVMYGVPSGTRKIVGAAEFQMLISRDGTLRTWGRPNMNYKVLNAMQSTERSTKFPTEVECMLGKFVVDAAAGRQFVALVCDDAQFHPPPNMPDNAELDVMVPQDARYPKGFTPKLTPTRYEEKIRHYFIRVVGAARAEVLLANLPRATVSQPAEKLQLKRRGAKDLHVGSKVRVWMSDVYALGTIIGRDLPGQSSQAFEVRWVREDWDPEIVTLASDDETLDDANDDRWQNLWFLPHELPAMDSA